jgi:hypothetical protein
MKPLKHVIAHSIYYAGTPLPDADSGPRKLLVDRPLEMLLVLIDPDSTSDVARRARAHGAQQCGMLCVQQTGPEWPQEMIEWSFKSEPLLMKQSDAADPPPTSDQVILARETILIFLAHQGLLPPAETVH